jgi:hypothetical protein
MSVKRSVAQKPLIKKTATKKVTVEIDLQRVAFRDKKHRILKEKSGEGTSTTGAKKK